MTPVADPPGRGGIAWARCSAERRGDMYVAGASFYHHLTENDRSELPEIIRACGGRGTRVVELAAGSGRITKALLAIGAEVIAVDNSPEMLRILEETIDADPRLSRRRSNLSVETGLMQEFCLDSGADVVVVGTSSISLLSAEDRSACFDRVWKMLRPGGRFVLSLLEVDLPKSLSQESTTVIDLGGEEFTLFEYVDTEALRRHVTVASNARPFRVWTTSTRILTQDTVDREAEMRGLIVASRTCVADAQHHIEDRRLYVTTYLKEHDE